MGNKKGLADPLKRLEQLIGILSLIASVRIKKGRLISPSGTEFTGFEVSFGNAMQPGETVIVDHVMKELKERVVADERDSDGHFKRLTIKFE